MSGAVRIVIGVVVFLILIFTGAFFYFKGQAPKPTEELLPVIDAPQPTPTPTLQERLSERLQGTTLEGSDVVVRELAGVVSDNPQLAAWLVNEDLVRRFVASVHNIAEGTSPRKHLDFLRPEEGFSVREKGEAVFVHPRAFARYDLVTEVVTAIDVESAMQLFNELEPLIDEAHREIGQPGTSFREVLDRAFDRLLAVPVLSGDEPLVPKVVTFRYADESLEKLPELERQFLRLGPVNVERIQAKLREYKAAFFDDGA